MNLEVGDTVKVNWGDIRFRAKITQARFQSGFQSVKFAVLGVVEGELNKDTGYDSVEVVVQEWWITHGNAFERISPLELLAECADEV